MASPPVIDFVRARLANVKACSDALALVKHSGLRGRLREILLEDVVAPYLPPHFDLLSGVIVGANGEERKVRNEDDVVLFDRSRSPLLQKVRGRDSLIPVTGVRAHIEVKSNLTLAELTLAVGAAAEINRIAMGDAPAGLIFAYGSEIGREHHIPDLLMDALRLADYRPASGQATCPIQGVCVLGRGTWLLIQREAAAGWYEVRAEDDHELLAFISVISNYAFGNGMGLGTHVLDTAWLCGPNPEMPAIVPSEPRY